jgi:hypothetical protein
MLDLLTVCSFVRYKRVFWYTRIITDGTSSVTSGKKMILDVKLGRFFFQGPNREADFKAVSNREFSLLQMLTGTRKETAKINQLHRTCFGAQGNQLMQYALRTEVMRCEALLFISTIRHIGNDITATVLQIP